MFKKILLFCLLFIIMFPLATGAITLEKCYEECNERVAQSGWESNMIEAAHEECYNTCRKFQTDGTLQSMASLQEGLNKLIDTATVDVELKKTGESITFTPNVPIGSFSGEMIVDEWLLAKYFQAWWSFILGSIGILAAVIIMWAGIKWITSRGNQSSISDAKDRIWSAIIGVLLAFFAVLIMGIINPRLTIIELPLLEVVNISTETKNRDYAQEVRDSIIEDSVKTTYDILDIEKNCPNCEITEMTPDSQLYAEGSGKEFIVRGNRNFYSHIIERGEKFTGKPSNFIPKCDTGQHCYKINSGNWLGKIHNTYWYWEEDNIGGYWRVLVW